MAPPTSYTDQALKEYMHRTLAATAHTLGWSVAAGSYDLAVQEAQRAYGTTANVALIEAHARRAVWQAVVNETAGDTDYTAANGTQKRKQIFESAQLLLAQAERHLMIVFGVGRATLLAGGGTQATSNEAVW